MSNPTLRLLTERRTNNLNAIRLFLALLVILSHCFTLTGYNEISVGEPLARWTHGQQTFGSLAVDMFFFISGSLIAGSWLRSKSMNDYLRRRILRIYPGYIVALFFSFLLGSAFALTRLAALQAVLLGFRDILSLGYSSSVGDFVFANNPLPNHSNGSLWTIGREFYCYLLVAAVGLFGLFRFRIAVLCISAILADYYIWTVLKGGDVEHADVRFLTFFLCGTSAWLWRDKIRLRTDLVLGLLVTLVLAALTRHMFRAVTPLAACYAVLWFGFARPIKMLEWCDKTDLSYGSYLFAFPVQQSLVALGVRNPWVLLLFATPLILGIAFLSWNLIEKPFLSLKAKDFADHDPGGGEPGSRCN